MNTATATAQGKTFRWPQEGVSRVPYQVFVDPAIYAREQERIFRGPTWNYVGLEAELPNPGDFKTTFIGDTPAVVSRGKDGQPHAFVNRCAYRGALVCRESRGNRATRVCVYHRWSYNLRGDLIGVPFRHGIEGKGGYTNPERAEHLGHDHLSGELPARGGYRLRWLRFRAVEASGRRR